MAAVTRRRDLHGGAARHHPGLPHRRRHRGGAVRVCLYSLGQFGRLPDLCGCSRPAHDDWRGGDRAPEVSVPVDILAIINLLFPLVHRVVVDTSPDYFHGVLSDSEFSILRMDIPENHNKTNQAQGD